MTFSNSPGTREEALKWPKKTPSGFALAAATSAATSRQGLSGRTSR